MTDIKLYEFTPTRSARCRWALLEADLPYESLGMNWDIIGSDELKKFHPLGKLPVAIIDGKPLFESAAIVTAVADLVPEKNLIAKPGSWGRALHDQWVCFALTELEAWLWNTAVNTFVLPEEQRITAQLAQNAKFFRRGAEVLERELQNKDYLVEDRFTFTDIIVGHVISFGNSQGLLDGFTHLHSYLDRLKGREYCTLSAN